jgi:hypothetical protein
MLRRMVFCRFLGMVGSLQMMSVREVGVMSGLFMRIFLMMLGSLVMMACGVLMVLGCLPMVFCSVVFCHVPISSLLNGSLRSTSSI